MAELSRGLARHSPRAHFAALRERVRGVIGRFDRLGPTLLDRPRRAAEAAARLLARECALLGRRRGECAETLARLEARMTRGFGERLQNRRARLDAVGQLLDAVSYRGVLARGFALVRDETDKPLRRRVEVSEGQRLNIEFADGNVAATAGERVGAPRTPPSLPPRRRTRDRSFEGQGSLF